MSTKPFGSRKLHDEMLPPHGKTEANFDRRFGAYVVRVLPGQTYATGAKQEMIVTVLGSCVSACIRNPRTGFGGMNHFMLPESDVGEWAGVSSSTRYGNFAMEALINEVLKSGCTREDLEVKIFGGAEMMGTGSVSMVGRKNVDFAIRYLEAEGLSVMSQDVGGTHGRRIHYTPATGKVQRMLLKDRTSSSIIEEERRYSVGLRNKPVEGEIDLFD